ncbi:methyltransferase domain-containing protein [Alteromonas sp. SM 2104]|nr:methyltransferase domain-containing protein [Alteromonas oceanisediminis]
MWQCPACRTPLHLSQRQWRCENGHCYDVAKQGYVNLLLAQQRNSKAPGDNNDMIMARRAFLQAGYYQPLADTLSELLINLAPKPLRLFDAGCGEGYYLGEIAKRLDRESIEYSLQGIDISKPAVQKAAKHHKVGAFAVASCFNIPLPASSQQGVVQVFAPSSPAEIRRILTDDGVWLVAEPGERHLYALKASVYDQPELHTQTDAAPEGFEQIAHRQVAFDFTLATAEQRENLLMMTPFYWQISETKKQRLLKTLSLVGADFSVRVYKPKSVAQ